MIRILALLTMLLDHIGKVFFPNTSFFQIIGRLAFPLFAWGIAKGVKRTRNCKLYALRLLLIALISQVPYSLLFRFNNLNVCFTLFTGLLVLIIYESCFFKSLKWLSIILLLIFSHIMNLEYGIYGVTTIFIFYVFDDKLYTILIQFICTVLGIFLYRYYAVEIFSILALPLIFFFEKYDFKINKVIQYSFYPLHIIILWILTITI